MIEEILPLPTLVTCAALAVYFWNLTKVGQARAAHSINAPASGGHPDFDRVMRVQINMTEQMVLFLPSLWLFAFLISHHAAAVLGLVWIAGRIIFSLGYYEDPQKRGPGFVIAIVATLILLCGSLIGAVLHLI